VLSNLHLLSTKVFCRFCIALKIERQLRERGLAGGIRRKQDWREDSSRREYGCHSGIKVFISVMERTFLVDHSIMLGCFSFFTSQINSPAQPTIID